MSQDVLTADVDRPDRESPGKAEMQLECAGRLRRKTLGGWSGGIRPGQRQFDPELVDHRRGIVLISRGLIALLPSFQIQSRPNGSTT